MSTVMKDLRNDVHKQPEQLEREADSARSAVEGTLAELEQRLSPGEILDRVMNMVKRHGGEFGENLLTQVRSNPMPTIIVGAGLAWLMAASKRSQSGDRFGDGRYRGNEDIGSTERWSSAVASVPNDATDGGDSMRDMAAAASDSVRATAESVVDAVQGAAASTMESAKMATQGTLDATSDAARRAADAVRHSAERVADASRKSIHGLTDGYAYVCREQPFMLGAIAIAAGAALGALLPATTAENSLLGEQAEAAKTRLKGQANARAGELRDAAAAALQTVRESVAGAGIDVADGDSRMPRGESNERDGRNAVNGTAGSQVGGSQL